MKIEGGGSTKQDSSLVSHVNDDPKQLHSFLLPDTSVGVPVMEPLAGGTGPGATRKGSTLQ